MRSNRMVDVIETHTEGQVVRTVTGGIDTGRLGGGSIAETVDAFDERYGWMMDFLTKEPRGHSNLVGAVPMSPRREEADVGYVFFDNSVYFGNCGDGVIGSTTALVETGLLEPRESITVEVPAGLVETKVRLGSDDRVEEVAIQGMRSFTYEETTATVRTDEGEFAVPVDVAYGGNWFAFVDAAALDLELDRESAEPDRIVDYGLQIREDVNERTEIVDPLTGEPAAVSITMFVDSSGGVDAGTIVYAAGSIGRSPCGTGTAAQLARLHAAGELEVDETYPIDSLFGTRFTGRILDVEARNGRTVTRCEVAGSANIIGKHTYLRDPDDELESFLI